MQVEGFHHALNEVLIVSKKQNYYCETKMHFIIFFTYILLY